MGEFHGAFSYLRSSSAAVPRKHFTKGVDCLSGILPRTRRKRQINTWIFTPKGFISGVQDKKHKNMVVVRSRHRDDLPAIFPGAEMTENEGTDYKFRVRISRERWVQTITALAEGGDYTNFKATIMDKQRHDVYLSVWRVMKKYQTALYGILDKKPRQLSV